MRNTYSREKTTPLTLAAPLLATLALASSTGCAAVGPGFVAGGLYSGYTVGSGATDKQGASKAGEACAVSVLGIVATGDASIDSAKRQGGITKVASVDHEVFSILGIYGQVCTVVAGE